MLFIQILNSKNKKEEDSSSRTRKLINHLFSKIRRKDEISTKIRFKNDTFKRVIQIKRNYNKTIKN